MADLKKKRTETLTNIRRLGNPIDGKNHALRAPYCPVNGPGHHGGFYTGGQAADTIHENSSAQNDAPIPIAVKIITPTAASIMDGAGLLAIFLPDHGAAA